MQHCAMTKIKMPVAQNSCYNSLYLLNINIVIHNVVFV